MPHLQLGARIPHIGPAVEERTTRYDVGSVQLGVEVRSLTGLDVPEHFDAPDYKVFDDGGVTIHVWGTSDGEEHIRFDCFRQDPHYHYSLNDSDSSEYSRVPYDLWANGDDMLKWAIDCLRVNLASMLSNTRGAHLTDQIDYEGLPAALAELEAKARLSQRLPS